MYIAAEAKKLMNFVKYIYMKWVRDRPSVSLVLFSNVKIFLSLIIQKICELKCPNNIILKLRIVKPIAVNVSSVAVRI